jgi:hypothetical protein
VAGSTRGVGQLKKVQIQHMRAYGHADQGHGACGTGTGIARRDDVVWQTAGEAHRRIGAASRLAYPESVIWQG